MALDAVKKVNPLKDEEIKDVIQKEGFKVETEGMSASDLAGEIDYVALNAHAEPLTTKLNEAVDAARRYLRGRVILDEIKPHATRRERRTNIGHAHPGSEQAIHDYFHTNRLGKNLASGSVIMVTFLTEALKEAGITTEAAKKVSTATADFPRYRTFFESESDPYDALELPAKKRCRRRSPVACVNSSMQF